ncbi:unnamed protein product [Allacma fusca]|uniref:Uncharacterized protein n=1 Tax=Allacma fusca TaxID=39272 RepID=A0A8J2P9B8_9HEXA|nr:unnamed protein product [Allacma fusca]
MPKPSRNGVSSSSWKHLKLILSLPYAICKMVMTISTGSQLIEGRGSGKMQYSCTSTVSVDVFKRIRRTHDVSFSTVIVSAANGAIARALRNSDMEVPENLDTDYTLPMPNHPGGLHFCA